MTTDPEDIRAGVAELLAGLPEISDENMKVADIDLDVVAARLEEAHGVLVRALESVETGASAGQSDLTWGRNR